MKRTLWSLTIDDDGGLSTSLYLSEQDAHDALHQYLCDWWDDAGLDDTPPEDQGEVICQYFERGEGDRAEIKLHDMEFPA